MRLYEFESKKLLKAGGIATPRGVVLTGSDGFAAATKELGNEMVLKAQVPMGGRQKAGGVLFASGPQEAEQSGRSLLGKQVSGYTVERLLVEERLQARQEFYMGVTYDPLNRCPLVMASAAGGVDIEEVARQDPSKLVKVLVDSGQPFSDYKGREVACALGLKGRALVSFGSVVKKLYDLFHGWDATIAEINPLFELEDGRFVAADAHIEIEDEALFRHPELSATFGIEPRTGEGRTPTPFEAEAAKIDGRDHRGVAGRVVEFDGSLGLLIGGGGASLTVFDAILDHGGKPANYCEIGGNPSVRKIQDLTKLLLSKPGVRQIAVIMNVVNNTRVDLVARGVIKGVVEAGRDPKDAIAVFRIPGAWEEEGFKVLKRYGVEYFDRTTSIDEAASRAVQKVGN